MQEMMSSDRGVTEHSRKLIEGFLRRHFRKPQSGILSRLLGESADYRYAIRSLCEHQASKYLGVDALLCVEVDEDFLWHKLSGGASQGIFAVAADRVSYLIPGAQEEVEHLLRSIESQSMTPPGVVAALCCDVLLSGVDTKYTVLTESGEIAEWYPESRGFRVNPEQLQKIEQNISAPVWKLSDEAISLEFCGFVSGFQTYQVRQIAVKLPKDSAMQWNEQVVADRVFVSTPLVRR